MTDPRVSRLCSEWQVSITERASSPVNEVWFGMRGEEHVVLKLGDARSRSREATALAAYRSAHSARLLEHDTEGALLIERVLLGDDLVPLASVDDDAATMVIGGLVAALHSGQDGRLEPRLPPLSDLSLAFDAPADARLDTALVARAAAVFAELVDDPCSAVLHGDLHHANVLRRGIGGPRDEWVAIDPHGWWGDPVFDTAPMMANPRGLAADGGRPLRERATRRAAILSEMTGYPRDRVLAWAFVGAVIAELWMIEDHDLVHGAPLALALSLAGDV